MSRKPRIPDGWEWLPEWLEKSFRESGRVQKDVADECQTTTQRISQLKHPKTPKDLPSVEILWRLRSAFVDRDDGFHSMEDHQIRLVLARLIVSLGPARLTYLAELNPSDASDLIDEHELKASARKRRH